MKQWQDDKTWSDGLIPEIKGILGLYLIGEANQDEDQERNTDLIVLRMEAVRIACRIRRNQYFQNKEYRCQFTIRSKRPSGQLTELAKILSGWGHYLFYGFADESAGVLAAYTLLDLNPFRLWFHTKTVQNAGRCPGIEKSNEDKSSLFRVFTWSEIPQTAIVAQKGI